MMKWIAGAVAAVIGILILSVFTLGMGFLGFQNGANAHENGIKAQYTQNQNAYDNGYKKVLEMSQVSDLYAADLEKVYRSALEGRYGDNGSQAVMQFITEQNPNLDPSIYRQIQQAIEGFRNQFQTEQRSLISRKQEYENYLTTDTSNRMYNAIGGIIGGKYPKIDLAKYDIVTSGRTETAFSTKKDEALTLRKPATAAK